jgi:hypothetical protein
VGSNLTFSHYFRKIYALPSEHGAWIWWIGPFLLGTVAGGNPKPASLFLFFAALLAFLSRQPTTLLVKVISNRRTSKDLRPSLFWMVLYGALALAITATLVQLGYSRLLLLAIPGIPVFLWQLWLVRIREERGQQGIELVGSGVLAMAAPAAYWVAGGGDPVEAWVLWGLSWLQSAASIVYVYLRLRQRKLDEAPQQGERWRMGSRTLVYHSFNFILSVVLGLMRVAPLGISLAFGLVLLDAIEGVARPPVGLKPTAIGLRQLGFSSLFFVVMSVAYVV